MEKQLELLDTNPYELMEKKMESLKRLIKDSNKCLFATLNHLEAEMRNMKNVREQEEIAMR